MIINLIAQNDTIKLKEIEVSANRINSNYKQDLRLVQVIEKDELRFLPVKSLSEILDYMVNVDIRQRGIHNVQADISIRGGNYEETLVMINGIPVNDPQTGHHNLNIPINMNNVERIEILLGGDARRYGANAFTGAINIITKEAVKNNLSVSLGIGDFEYYEGQTSATFNLANMQNFISLSHYQSNGYRPNTDFIHSQGMWQISHKKINNRFQLLFALENKAFGANSFYTPKYPFQFEQTHTLFSSLTNKHLWQKTVLTTQFYYRQHHDKFELFRHDLPSSIVPSWYTGHNYHMTQVAGGQSYVNFNLRMGKTTVGADYRYEHIYSNVLGELMNDTLFDPFESEGKFTREAQKVYTSFFVDQEIHLKKWIISAGIMATYLYKDKLYFYPGTEVAYDFKKYFTLFVSCNRSLRLPTYTELYYKDAANKGNINLKPEEANNYEFGIKFNRKIWQSQIAYFYRQGKNIIDWIRATETDIWHSENITEVNTSGVDFSSVFNNSVLHPKSVLKQVRLNYSYTTITKQNGQFYSKYALDVLRNKIAMLVTNRITEKLSFSWTLMYHERMGTYTEYPSGLEKLYKPYVTVDAKISFTLNNFKFYVSGTNLFNTYYYDIANIPMPDRWVKGGIIWSLKNN